MANIRNLDLNLLLVLDTLFEEQSVSRAAKQMRLSQPTISFSLNKLRTFFDDELFVRAGGAMVPTPRAEALRDPVKRMRTLLETEIATAAVFDPGTTERVFTVSTSDIGELVFLPALLEALRTRAPHVRIVSRSMPPAELQQAMTDGKVDLAIGYFPDFAGGTYFEQKLFDHPFACLARKGHPAFVRGMSLAAFLEADHAVVSQEGRSQEIFERALAEAKLSRRVMLHSQHFMTVPLLIAGSDLVATVPRAVALAYSRMTSLEVFAPPMSIPNIELKQFWHRRTQQDPANMWFRRLTSELFLRRDPSTSGAGFLFA
ncbi:MAG: LysR family transcriptional regulator [Sphingomonas hengshuiensis]|uniref:LysR family transcriptional regulator n=1 Tax=Sphingomonas hengshuiensis TaxID=1609977 RepID=A0A2W4YY95_9SPHN|nr:MAG: LysR family transcriptional regulator [Sphingomonas hengshuiensis]